MWQKDQLAQYFSDNKNQLHELEPPLGHFSRFNKRLVQQRAQHKPKSFAAKKILWVACISIFILIFQGLLWQVNNTIEQLKPQNNNVHYISHSRAHQSDEKQYVDLKNTFYSNPSHSNLEAVKNRLEKEVLHIDQKYYDQVQLKNNNFSHKQYLLNQTEDYVGPEFVTVNDRQITATANYRVSN